MTRFRILLLRLTLKSIGWTNHGELWNAVGKVSDIGREIRDSHSLQEKSGHPCPIRITMAVPLTLSPRGVLSASSSPRFSIEAFCDKKKKLSSRCVDILPSTTSKVEGFALPPLLLLAYLPPARRNGKRQCRKIIHANGQFRCYSESERDSSWMHKCYLSCRNYFAL